MKTQSTITVIPKYKAALIGLAAIFGFTTLASATPYPYKDYLYISSVNEGLIPVVIFNYMGASSTNDGVTATMVVKRYVDKYSPSFLADQFTGTSLGTVTLSCEIFNGLGQLATKLVFTMSDCQIISITEEGSGDKPEEDITFGFSQIGFTYTHQ